MANLVSNEYYTGTWMGTAASSDAELTKMLSRAEDVILMQATKKITISNINTWVQKAICAQAEHLINGAYEIMIGAEGAVDSASLGQFSYSERESGGGDTFQSEVVSKLALQYLNKSGFRSAVIWC